MLLLGCGGDGEAAEAEVSERVTTYFTALSARDFETACSSVTPLFRTNLAAYAATAFPDLDSRQCAVIAARIAETNGEEAVELQRRVRVLDVAVDGENATARLGPGQTASLRRVDDSWLIDELDFSGAVGG
ncbi:MAG: hypothetical protein M3R12_08425 [Actinomycetota bacterium]|nr:hypothetical protein [Actinomycetota bacterium]